MQTKWVIRLLFLALCGCQAYAQTSSSGPVANAASTQVLTSGTSFITATTVTTYKLVAIGGCGGGASSSGVGAGGSGASPNLTICEHQGGGATIAYTLGAAGAKGAAGVGGANGGNTIVESATQCTANGGGGGTVGTASAGAGGTVGGANTVGAITVGNNQIGAGIVSYQGLAGSSGSAFQPQTYGLTAGAGCAGANCTTNTAGCAGELIVIPEVY